MLPPLFACQQAFRDAFEQGLTDMLSEHDELGVTILVLANASFDATIWARLRPQLRHRFQLVRQRLLAADTDGRQPAAAPDDLLVFRKLMQLGFDALQPTRFRSCGPWEVQFNQLRALRPPRISHAHIDCIQAPFDPDGFHFNKPFLAKEMLWEGELQGLPVRLLYNKFPFVDLHGLLVPEPEACHPQFLQRRHHDDLWRLTLELGDNMPGVGFGYNSYGAYASVNQLHFQMFIRDRPLPVCDPYWQHNGGERPYPSTCYRLDDPQQAWDMIARLSSPQQPGIGYNLIYRPGRLYLLPRKLQGGYAHAEWTGGFAWYEMAGGFTAFDAGTAASLNEGMIVDEFQKLRVSPSLLTAQQAINA